MIFALNLTSNFDQKHELPFMMTTVLSKWLTPKLWNPNPNQQLHDIPSVFVTGHQKGEINACPSANIPILSQCLSPYPFY